MEKQQEWSLGDGELQEWSLGDGEAAGILWPLPLLRKTQAQVSVSQLAMLPLQS